ncbi:MAG TPA: hypothetical protein VM580_02655 [Labilithrix sp.]|nr:hypothetical protein [Labilithrix sp.]
MRSDPVKHSGDSRQLELPIRPRVDAPNGEAARAETERAMAIVEALRKRSGDEGGEDVFAAFEELDQLPPDVVCAALSDWTGPAPDPVRLDDATRRAHGFPPRPLRLRTVSLVRDADIFDLGPFAEEQLRLAGRTWDGADLSAEERLDGESPGSFAGTLEHRVLAEASPNAANAPLFDVLLYADNAGSIFRAGTTELVGAIAYGVVEMKDRRARIAIQQALQSPAELDAATPSAVAAEAATPKLSAEQKKTSKTTEKARPVKAKPTAAGKAKKKAAASRATSKTTASKKAKEPAVKPTAPKKAEAKKTTAAKKAVTTPTKSTAKKVAAKKPTAKKATGPESAARKTVTPNKVATKKAAVKKTAATKVPAKKTAATKAPAKKKAAAPESAPTSKRPTTGKGKATKSSANKRQAKA